MSSFTRLRTAFAVLAASLLAVSAAWAQGTANSELISDYNVEAAGPALRTEPRAPADLHPEPGPETARKQPEAFSPADRFSLPGQLVVGPGAGASPRVRIPARPAGETPGTVRWPFLSALMVLAGLAPALGWVLFRRAGRASPEAGAVAGLENTNQGRAPRPAGPPAASGAELDALRSEVISGLQEMKERAHAFTDALETGLDDLQSEIARARRTLHLLRRERRRTGASKAVRRPPAGPRDATTPRPTLDPAWLLLEDPAGGLVVPPVKGPAQRNVGPSTVPFRAGSIPARPAGRESDTFRRALDFTTPAERREMIIELAREGKGVQEIARDLKVGLAEVSLALSKSRLAPGVR